MATFVRSLFPCLVAVLIAAPSIAAESLKPNGAIATAKASLTEARPAKSDEELRYWLENMVWYHRFTDSEITAATGLSGPDVQQALRRFHISSDPRPTRLPESPLLVLPYPGGRHPRMGFLDGAVRPQRETKFSVFTPWDPSSYVVVDLPEALWSNLGLTYLAHTHIPTIFDRQGQALEPLEWTRHPDGELSSSRRLPNGIAFATRVVPKQDGVRMEMWLTNGTDHALSDLRVQMCVMLKGAAGFAAQTNANKVITKPYVACRSEDGNRWIVSAWEPCHHPWANPPVPCLHSDPKFPDCPPGETRSVRGWLSFYVGTNIQAEFSRLDKIGWAKP